MQNPVTINGYSKITSTTKALTDTPVAIVSAQTSFAPKEVIIQNDPASTANALIGHSSGSTPFDLDQGVTLRLYISKPELIFARTVGVSTATLNILILGD